MIMAVFCCKCKCEVWIPDALYEAAQQGREKIEFYCAYGHPLVFSEGETEEQKLRRERDRLVQRIAERDDEIARQKKLRQETERKLTATRGVVTRIKNRVGNGVCPCCNRFFGNLAEHMTDQHPGYAKEAVE